MSNTMTPREKAQKAMQIGEAIGSSLSPSDLHDVVRKLPEIYRRGAELERKISAATLVKAAVMDDIAENIEARLVRALDPLSSLSQEEREASVARYQSLLSQLTDAYAHCEALRRTIVTQQDADLRSLRLRPDEIRASIEDPAPAPLQQVGKPGDA